MLGSDFGQDIRHPHQGFTGLALFTGPDTWTAAQTSQLQETVHSTLLLGCFYLLYMLKILICLVCFVASFKLLLCNCCWFTVCIVVVDLCMLLSNVYLLYCVGIAFFFLLCWLEVSIRKVLRSATTTQVFLGFPVSISKC